MLGLRRKAEPTRPAPKPYDYAEEARLIAAGDLNGWRKHVEDRPASSILDLVVHVSDCVSRINDVRKEQGNE